MSNTGSLQNYFGIDELVISGRPLIMVKTFEEDRLNRILSSLADHGKKDLWVWDITGGLVSSSGKNWLFDSVEGMLEHLLKQDSPPFVLLKDLYHHFRPTVLRFLRALYYAWRDKGGAVVLSAVMRTVPEDLEREMAFLSLEMPSNEERLLEIGKRVALFGSEISVSKEAISSILKGLTLSEIGHSLSRLSSLDLKNEKELLKALQEEKKRLVQKTGTLELISHVPSLKELGGLENLKDWLNQRRELLLSNDEQTKEITPKGLLLMGVSGCGKSLCVKAISAAWQLPLYRLEMSKVFSGAYGSPEQAFSEACQLMGDMAPAVLWIDEIEMGLSAEGSAASNPTMSRIFAFFLTWMQEKPSGLFVAATANRIDLLPAEMIRKGRFDQVFFVDLPTLEEREQIFSIHLKKRGYNPHEFTPEVFADATEGWSGAEVEQCVVSAITSARIEKRNLELKDLYAARKQIVPISTTMEEQVRHIRNWAYERAVRASVEN